MNGPTCMYAIQPAFESSVRIEYPQCMYEMKNIQADLNCAAISQVNVEKPLSILDQKPIMGMKELEIRQDAILEQLAQLKQQVAALRANLNLQSAPVQTIPKPTAYVDNSFKRSQKINLMQQDVVINSSPQYPPYSLLAVRNLWNNRVRLQVSWHTHSNIGNVSDPAKNFMDSNWDTTANNNLPLLKILVVWKNVGADTELIIMPMSRITVRGEVNILRFLSNLGPSIFTEDVENKPALNTEVDSVLDTCHSLVWSRTVKERQALVRLLNGKLQKSTFLIGNAPTIADIAAWSVIKQVVASKDLTVNMNKWSQFCSDLFSKK